MKTILIDDIPEDKEQILALSDDHLFKKAAAYLRDGGVVAFPTETVYGLGANAFMPDSIKNIYKIKGRPSDNPLIVHVSEKHQIDQLVSEIPQCAEKLIKSFMPGPLTIVLKKSELVPYEATAGLDTVAIRMPLHPVASAFISLAGVPVAAPSANISGKPSTTSAEHVMDDFSGKIPYIINGGNCRFGLESTVVDVTNGTPVILRPGSVTYDEILECCLMPEGTAAPDKRVNIEGEPARSPGMKYRHYSPDAAVIAAALGETPYETADSIEKLLLKNKCINSKIAIFAGDEVIQKLIAKGLTIYAMPFGPFDDVEKASKELFKALRKADEIRADTIIVQSFPETGLGAAYMNRVMKASAKE